jgi:hypothetical protein
MKSSSKDDYKSHSDLFSLEGSTAAVQHLPGDLPPLVPM